MNLHKTDEEMVAERYFEMRDNYKEIPIGGYMSDGMTEMLAEENALEKQVGGNHYASMAIQPVEFIVANELGFLEGNIVKYVCRHHAKNGAEDIMKAIHYCELLLQTKYGGE